MKKIAFICHPLEFQQLVKIDAGIHYKSPRLVRQMMAQIPPSRVRTIEITSPSGEKLLCELICVWLLPDQFITLDKRLVANHLMGAFRLAQELQCELVGLGAYTKVAEIHLEHLLGQFPFAVTTGNTYTAALSAQALEAMLERSGLFREQITLTVVGARGAIGYAVAQALAPRAGQLHLVGRNLEALEPLAQHLRSFGCKVRTFSEAKAASQESQFIFLATSDPHLLIRAADLSMNTMVVDVSKPANILPDPSRLDVTLVDCAMVQTPPRRIVDNWLSIFPEVEGLDTPEIFACFAETMILAFEKRKEFYSWGRMLEIRKFPEILAMARQHGFSTKIAWGPWSPRSFPTGEPWKESSFNA